MYVCMHSEHHERVKSFLCLRGLWGISSDLHVLGSIVWIGPAESTATAVIQSQQLMPQLEISENNCYMASRLINTSQSHHPPSQRVSPSFLIFCEASRPLCTSPGHLLSLPILHIQDLDTPRPFVTAHEREPPYARPNSWYWNPSYSCTENSKWWMVYRSSRYSSSMSYMLNLA